MISAKTIFDDFTQKAMLTLFMYASLPGVSTAFAEEAASSSTMADTITGILSTQLSSLPNLIAAVCYIGGIITMTSGVLRLKDHAENSSQHKIAPGISRMFAGSALVALPTFVGWVYSTAQIGGTSVSWTAFNSGMKNYTGG